MSTELDSFPQEGATRISVELVRRLSPDSLSVMEFKSAMDVTIAEKMLQLPAAGRGNRRQVARSASTREFDMTNDSYLFQDRAGQGAPAALRRQDDLAVRASTSPNRRYWVERRRARKALLGRDKDTGQSLDYQNIPVGVSICRARTRMSEP